MNIRCRSDSPCRQQYRIVTSDRQASVLNLTPSMNQDSSVGTRNILSLVGNGFDIQVLQHFNKSITTSYLDFYQYATNVGISRENPILLKMEEARLSTPDDTNWSDVEAAIGHLDPRQFSFGAIQPHLLAIQRIFASFLNECVTPSLLSDLDELSAGSDLAIHTFAHLVEDVTKGSDLERIHSRIPGFHGSDFMHTIINFNYTDLLDNFVYLDSAQFDPRPHATSGSNFKYNNDPRGLLVGGEMAGADNVQFCQLRTQVLHPHGRQSIPRSLLFGTGALLDSTAPEARMTKPFQAQYEKNYKSLLSKADMFIIFGSSLGESDSWWWDNITAAMREDESKHLILYSHGAPGAGEVAIDSLLRHSGIDELAKTALREQIVPVEFESSVDHTFLGMADECSYCVTDPKKLGYKVLKEMP